MALDSKEKRAAVFGVARPWMRDKLPIIGKDEGWRLASGNAYPVASLSPPVPGGGLGVGPVFRYEWLWDMWLE